MFTYHNSTESHSLGSWRRKPDARRTWGSLGYNTVDRGVDRLKELLPLQQHILRRAARLVKPGGRLVYVTCSLLPCENEHQIEKFIRGEEGEANGEIRCSIRLCGAF